MRAREFIMERPPEFKGSVCTKDCSGHKAGYLWALRKGLRQSPKFPKTVHPSFQKGAGISTRERDQQAWNDVVQTRQVKRSNLRNS